MSLHLTDLDELVLHARNTNSKSYLSEAVSAYRAGAYRAAVTTTWVSVCVDIIEKIKELSIGNDPKAKQIEDKLNKIKPHDFAGMQSFEKEILTYACEELELISFIEKSHLESLKNDRNICAHPTFSIDGSQFVPTPELTRTYIVQAAKYLHTNAPMRGKVVVEEIYRLINEDSFPEDDEKAFVVLSSDKYLGRVKDSSIRNLTLILLKRLFKDEAVFKTYHLLDRIFSALGAISRINSIIFTDVMKNNFPQLLADANDKRLKRVLPLLSKRGELWSKIDNAVKIRLEVLIGTMNSNDLIKYKVSIASSAIPSINKIFQSLISKDEFEGIDEILKSTPSMILMNKAIEIFINSQSFASAYTNGMNILIPHSKFITDDDLNTLFDGIYKNKSYKINQILNAGGMEKVLSTVYINTKHNVHNHSKLWLKFIKEIEKKSFKYAELNELLIFDGVIEAVETGKEDELEKI